MGNSDQEHFETLFDALVDPVAIVDGKGKILAITDWVEKLTGFKKEELIGKNMLRTKILPERSKVILMKNLEKRLLGNRFSPYEIMVNTKQGGKIPVEVNASKIMYNGKSAVMAVFRDITERKTAEIQLKESEERYRLLFELSPIAVAITSLKGAILSTNKAFQALFGFSDKELKKKNAADFYLNAEDRTKMLKELKRDGKVTNFNIKAKRKDGTVLDILLNVSLIHLKDEDLLQTSLVNITESKRMEMKLRRSEEKYRDLFTKMYEGVFQTTLDGRFVTVNPALVRMLGYKSEDELKKINVKDLYVNPKDRSVFLKRMKTLGKLKDTELVLRRKDGAEIIVLENSHAVEDENGEISYFEGTLIDITERKKMEDLLKESEHFYRTLFETTGTATVVLEDDMTISSVNKEFENLSGYLKEDVQDKMSLERFILKDDIDRVKDYHERRGLDPDFAPHSYQYHFIDRWGDVKDVVATATIITGTSRRVVSLLDVTELEKIKETMKIKDAVLASSINRARDIEMKERFVSVATHELRTPLISIKGYVDYILSGKLGEVSERVESSLTVVKRNTDRLLNLTNSLLDVRRLESGRLELNREELDFQEVINHCVKEIRPFVDEKNQTFRVSTPEQSLMIVGDRVRLSQVVMNLLNNAVKFTPKKGTISLKVENGGDEVEVCVSDTGIGIRKEEIDRVFKLFADIKKPGYFKGTGIGLSVSKGLVEAHGGAIVVESEGEGKGSTFMFTLPKNGSDKD